MALPFMLVVLFAWLLAFRETFRLGYRLCAENNLVEMGTFLAFLGASVVGLLLSIQARGRDERPVVWGFYLFIAIVSFVAAGEEVSWGQSFLHFRTPGLVRNINEQGEFTIHNLKGAQDLNALVLLCFGVAGLFVSRRFRRPELRKVAVPPVVVTYFVVITIMGAISVAADVFLLPNTFAVIVGIMAEVIELLMGLACLLYVVLNARRLGAEWKALADV